MNTVSQQPLANPIFSKHTRLFHFQFLEDVGSIENQLLVQA